MAVALSKLPFSPGALEPYISKKTITYHYGKHHKNYVTNLNKLISGTHYDRMNLHEIVFESHNRPGDEKIFNNAAQAWNHTFFWRCLSSKAAQRPGPRTSALLNEKFGSLQNFKDNFTNDAMEVFGSGWAWLIRNGNSITIECTHNADTPIAHKEQVLLACDLWEHAYYLDYQNDRKKFLEQYWKILNWDFIEENLQKSEIPYERNSIKEHFRHDLRI